MNDSVLFALVTFGLIVWVLTYVIEVIYNRCKKRRYDSAYTDAINALSALSRRHEGWHHGMGACQCDEHRTARLVIRRYHERGNARR